MIKRLSQQEEKTAKAIQKIQKPAYQVEAKLMGFEGIPQLNESVLEIQNSGETFIGYIEDDLKGFISYTEENRLIDICRLVVDPEHFRQGIARKLLVFLLERFVGYDFIVSTGSANTPAKKLYDSLGFIESRNFEVAPGIYCTEFQKKKQG